MINLHAHIKAITSDVIKSFNPQDKYTLQIDKCEFKNRKPIRSSDKVDFTGGDVKTAIDTAIDKNICQDLLIEVWGNLFIGSHMKTQSYYNVELILTDKDKDALVIEINKAIYRTVRIIDETELEPPQVWQTMYDSVVRTSDDKDM